MQDLLLRDFHVTAVQGALPSSSAHLWITPPFLAPRFTPSYISSVLSYHLIHYSRRMLCRVQLHSAKKALHSAKPLPSAALGKELSAYPFTAKASLPSVACRALGKGFPECHNGTRQRKAAVMAMPR